MQDPWVVLPISGTGARLSDCKIPGFLSQLRCCKSCVVMSFQLYKLHNPRLSSGLRCTEHMRPQALQPVRFWQQSELQINASINDNYNYIKIVVGKHFPCHVADAILEIYPGQIIYTIVSGIMVHSVQHREAKDLGPCPCRDRRRSRPTTWTSEEGEEKGGEGEEEEEEDEEAEDEDRGGMGIMVQQLS